VTTDYDRHLLLRIAREAIAAHVRRQLQSAVSNLQSSILSRPAGAFVTLHKGGELRGCIGHIEATEPIGVVVPRCAVAACSTDSRFAPITPDELHAIDIEISLLGPLEAIA
jgi:AmmeMemoRadiSam system protein A